MDQPDQVPNVAVVKDDEPESEVITFKVVGSVIDYTSFPHENLFDSPSDEEVSVPDYLNAEELMQNVDTNNAVVDFVKGFESLSYQKLRELEDAQKGDDSTRKLQSANSISLGDMDTTVTDVGKSQMLFNLESLMHISYEHILSCHIFIDCPEGLDYAPTGA